MDLYTHVRALERRRRIFVSLSAYAYEYTGDLLIDDAEYDELSRRIDSNQETIEDYYEEEHKNRVRILDEFFKHHFHPDTGMWIRKHPELDRVQFQYQKVKSDYSINRLPLI